MLMQMAPPAPARDSGPRPTPRRRAAYVVEYVGARDPGRDTLEAFIASTYFQTYGARISHFCATLLGCRDANGAWIAGLGFSLAEHGPTFLEQYLDQPLEAAIGARARQAVGRHQIVEVGNLAAHQAGAARALIVAMTRLLHERGLHWVAFTATASLLNSFARLRLQPGVLGEADPRRLADGGQHWGSYYDNKPQVMFGDIRYGYAQLS